MKSDYALLKILLETAKQKGFLGDGICNLSYRLFRNGVFNTKERDRIQEIIESNEPTTGRGLMSSGYYWPCDSMYDKNRFEYIESLIKKYS